MTPPDQQATQPADDPSNGYEAIAHLFASGAVRGSPIGVAAVRRWAATLPHGSDVLDIGCGTGFPISQTLIDCGHHVYGVDASPTMIAAFRQRFPEAPAECASVESSQFFHRQFDGIVAWGLMFLLEPETQRALIPQVARALKPGGRLLFTSPKEVGEWLDNMTRRPSYSLGYDAYRRMIVGAGLEIVGEDLDEGRNYYYLSRATSSDG
ncbi:MAG: class I SAM-dependent methyltransferase [Gemmatimonadaceae bacterium]